MIWAALVLGALWRRWWGWTQPRWLRTAQGKDRPGVRAVQAVLGAGALFALCLVAHPWWEAGFRTGLAMALLTERAQCIPIIWAAWERAAVISWLKTHWTWGAEATCGALVFAAAI